ncbi:MAG TPA: hypothetical protein VK358_16075 [Longimicrobium sp.]|nr:hypothetical protein [Longimicrobium sp.]
MSISRLRCLTAILALAALPACENPERTDVEITGMQTGVTRQQFDALPDSVQLGKDTNDSRGEVQGVTVDVVVKIGGQKGRKVPLDYTLHDVRNDLPFVSRRMAMEPDQEQWSRAGRVWLPVPSPGTYYVRVVLADSTGRSTSGPRTEDFTIQ